MNYQYHHSSTVELNASAKEAFEHLDDQMKLSSHMGKSSWMMAGSKMDVELDQKKGREVGSVIVLKGRMMGLELFVREIVKERTENSKKVWETDGPQKLIVIDQYRMGFELVPHGSKTQLRVFIDYNLPPTGLLRIAGQLLGATYANWCTKKMAEDAAARFAP